MEPGLSTSVSITENNVTYDKSSTYPYFYSVYSNFYCDNQIIDAGSMVQFFNTSAGCPPDQVDYQWIFEGGTPGTSTEKNPQILYVYPGTYDVRLTCQIPSDSSIRLMENYITVYDPNDIRKTNSDEPIVFPSPSSGQVFVKFPIPGNYCIRILDFAGREVAHALSKMNSKILPLNLEKLSWGVYFIEIKGDRDIDVQKVILH